MNERRNRRGILAAVAGVVGTLGAAMPALADLTATGHRNRTPGLGHLLPVRDVETIPGKDRHTYRLLLVDDRYHHLRGGRVASVSRIRGNSIKFAWLSPRGHHAIVELVGDIDASVPGEITVTGEARFLSVVPNPEVRQGESSASTRYAPCAPGFDCVSFCGDTGKGCIATFVPCNADDGFCWNTTGFCSLC